MKMKLVMILVAACGLCVAQNTEAAKEPVKFYKLEFVLRDLEGGKVLSARNYSMLVSTGENGQIRAGAKVSIPLGIGLNTAQYQTIDIGTSVDCRNVRDLKDDVSLSLAVDSTSVLPPESSGSPLIRQNKWSSQVVVPLKKPTVVFSSDDAATKHVLQFEVTATPR